MALEDSLKEFSKKPLGYKAAVFVGIYAVFGFFYWQFMYSGLSDDLGNLRVVGKRIQDEHTKLKKRESDYKTLVKRNEKLKEQLQQNRVSLPSTAELPSFFVHLQKQAASSGVSIHRWGRGKEIPVSFYVKVPVNITIGGTYYQILQYFSLLSQTDRIITVENLRIGGATVRNDETLLSASFQASTFRLAGDGLDDQLFPGDDAKKKTGKKDKKKRSRAEAAKDKVNTANRKREKDVADRMGEPTAKGDGDTAAKPAPDSGGDKTKKGVNRLKNPGAGGIQ